MSTQDELPEDVPATPTAIRAFDPATAEYRNPVWSNAALTTIDIELFRNDLQEWVGCNLTPFDIEPDYLVLYERVKTAGEIGAYVAPTTSPYSISKMTPWDRMTEAEAELMENFMDSASAKMRQTYNAAQYLESSHPLFAYLEQVMAATLPGGEARAKELLAPEGN